MSYFIGADLGTSALKLILTDETGKIIESVTKEYDVIYPRDGWSEQNPEDWWNAFVLGIKNLTENIDASLIKGIAVSGQMHGLVTLDEEDRVIRPAILWNDTRTGKETDYLNTVIGKQKLSDLTSNIAFAGFTAPKILWMKENEPENFSRIKKIMLPKDYINYRLTGVFATDFSDASGMLLLDVKNRKWSKEMLEVCSVKEEQLPKLFESYECIGTVSKNVLGELGLEDIVKVAAGAGDNAGAAIGNGTSGNGKCNISLGTSGTIFISAENHGLDENNALHSFCHADGKYHLMACMLSAASCNKWFCDNILMESDYASLQKNIDADMLGSNNVFFLPYMMGERSPVNDSDASGMFIGLRPNTTREEMLLAIMEGVAFAVKDNIEIAKKLGIDITESTVCGGGAKSELWLKILSNVLGIALLVPEKEEGPAFGSAILAMCASGERSIEDTVKPSIIKMVNPEEDIQKKYAERYSKFTEIYPVVKSLYKKLREE